jgi:hypothetical protein
MSTVHSDDIERCNLSNYTPHEVRVCLKSGKVISYPSQGIVRLTSEERDFYEPLPNGIEVISPQVFNGVEGLPSVGPGERLPPIIVSMPAAEYMVKNPSCYLGAVYAPDGSPMGAIRDSKGNTLGVKYLTLYCHDRQEDETGENRSKKAKGSQT